MTTDDVLKVYRDYLQQYNRPPSILELSRRLSSDLGICVDVDDVAEAVELLKQVGEL